jgi:protein MpaA
VQKNATYVTAVFLAATVVGPMAMPVRAIAATTSAQVRDVVELGLSRQGRPLVAVHIGDPLRPPVLIVGSIHGNETAAIAAVTALAARREVLGANLWLVADANPDGVHAGTRQNAAGVDLNRNFPFRWQPAGYPGTLHYTGPAALSEPESRALAALIRRVRPAVGIWFHQSLDVVDVSQGPRLEEDLMSRLLGLRERSLPDYRGSAVGYEDQLVPRSAFVVELPAGTPSPNRSRVLIDSIVKTARSVAG